MRLKLLAAMTVTAVLPGAAPGRGDLLQVQAVRHWAAGEATRIAIEVNSEFTYHSERLHNPERIFFDIFKSRPAIQSKRFLNRELEDRLLMRIRVAETLPGVTRIVLDLRGDAESTVSQLANPNRLVIELRRARSAPAETAAPQALPVSSATSGAPPAGVVVKPGLAKVGGPEAPAATPAQGAAGTAAPRQTAEPPARAPSAAKPTGEKPAATPGQTAAGAAATLRERAKPAAKAPSASTPVQTAAGAAATPQEPVEPAAKTPSAATPGQTAATPRERAKPAAKPPSTSTPVQTAAGAAATPQEPVEPAAKPPSAATPGQTAAAPRERAKPAAKPPSASKPAATPAPTAAGTDNGSTAPVRTDAAKAARRTSNGQNSLIRALGLKLTRVVLDPGHGGHDHGTMGPKGLLEKELVLDIAQRLGKLIESRLGAEVVYTRSDDTFVPLERRTAIANEKKADLFLSLHANSSPLPRISGVETYYLNFTDSKEALDVASRENASSEKSIFELRDIIHKITLHEKMEESREFAGRIQSALYSFSARALPGSRNRGVKKAPFVVLIGASMPSVLAEIGFLSNTREEALLKKAEHRDKLAEALFRGLSRYAEGLSHFQLAARE